MRARHNRHREVGRSIVVDELRRVRDASGEVAVAPALIEVAIDSRIESNLLERDAARQAQGVKELWNGNAGITLDVDAADLRAVARNDRHREYRTRSAHRFKLRTDARMEVADFPDR